MLLRLPVFRRSKVPKFINKKSNLALTVDVALSRNGTKVHLWADENVYNQEWLLKSCGDGYYNIISKCNGLYLDAGGADSNVLIWAGHGLNHQKWKFVPYVPVVEVSSISLDKTALTLTEGGLFVLTATVNPANATDKTLTWTSSNTAIATVSNGTVTAKAAGTASITVKSANGRTAVC